MRGSEVKILSTRLLDDMCIRKAAEHGIHITCRPFISITPVNDAIADGCIAALAQQQILAVFTSRNAVRAIGEKAGRPDWDIACISGHTAEEAGAFFGEERVKVRGADSKELAAHIITYCPRKPVVFFCGNLRLNYLPARLTEAGISIREITVYHTNPAPVKIKEAYDGIVFFSPSAADSFFSLNHIDAGTVLFAIGDTTARNIKKYTDNPLLRSKHPSQLSITESIINYYDKK